MKWLIRDFFVGMEVGYGGRGMGKRERRGNLGLGT